jgi:hypothetical protein
MRSNKFIGLLLTFFTALLSHVASAQSYSSTKSDTTITHRPENIYAEIGSAGLFYSLNYDTRFGNQRNGLGVRLGFAIWSPTSTTFISVPFQLNYLIGHKSNFLELGAGATLLTANKPYYGNPLLGNHFTNISTSVLPTTTIGYRHQPFHHGVNFGVSVNPMLLNGIFIPYFGGSLGYTFK